MSVKNYDPNYISSEKSLGLIHRERLIISNTPLANLNKRIMEYNALPNGSEKQARLGLIKHRALDIRNKKNCKADTKECINNWLEQNKHLLADQKLVQVRKSTYTPTLFSQPQGKAPKQPELRFIPGKKRGG